MSEKKTSLYVTCNETLTPQCPYLSADILETRTTTRLVYRIPVPVIEVDEAVHRQADQPRGRGMRGNVPFFSVPA
jgi:hypothetical protein